MPHGSVISPALFSFFTADLPDSAEVTSAFADDVTVLDSGRKVADLVPSLQASIDSMVSWASRNDLALAPTKSNIVLFTSDTQ